MIREAPEYGNDCVIMNSQHWDGLFPPVGPDTTFLAPFFIKFGLELREPHLPQVQAHKEFEDLIIAYQMNPQDVQNMDLTPRDSEIDNECDNRIKGRQPFSVAKNALLRLGYLLGFYGKKVLIYP
jgi:hypothetical protein